MNMAGTIQIVRAHVGDYFVESIWLWVEYNLCKEWNNFESMYDSDFDFLIHKSLF